MNAELRHRLSAIPAADAAGYARLMAEDDRGRCKRSMPRAASSVHTSRPTKAALSIPLAIPCW
jgi:hypothetical protein